MWLSEQSAAIRRSGDAPEVAAVTIPGSSPAARVGSERRGLTVMAPGGYVWIPGRDAEVLTVQCATGETAVSGQRMDVPPAGMQPGRCISTPPAARRCCCGPAGRSRSGAAWRSPAA